MSARQVSCPGRSNRLSGDFKAELIKPRKRGQIRAGEGSPKHVEVF
ncbi:hypothetical protein ABZX12_38220 [Kribbella sp. NPDC003505]